MKLWLEVHLLVSSVIQALPGGNFTLGVFIKKTSPDKFLVQHQLLIVPLMTGVNNHEGSWLLLQVSVKDLTDLQISP